MKFWKVFCTILVWLVVVLAVFMMVFTIVSVTTFNSNQRTLFGYRALIVMSDSMSATDFSAGDLVLTRYVDPDTLQPGDIIAYSSLEPDSYGETITHKIRSRATNASGEPGFVTYGTTTDTDDAIIVTYPYVLGKYTGRIPKAGSFFLFLKTTPGYIVCILLPFLLLILMEGVHCIRLFKQYKSEQQTELNEERERLRKDREETQRMKSELAELMSRIKDLDEDSGESPKE